MIDFSKLTLVEHLELIKKHKSVPFDIHNPKDMEDLRNETLKIAKDAKDKRKNT